MGRWLIANSRYYCLSPSRLTKLISLIISFCLILEQSVFAQTIDLSHYFARGSAQAIPQSDKFRPLHLRYISYDNQANDFKILLDKGDFFNQKTEKTLELEKNTQELMKYFFIGLTLPNEKFWVNLRPDSPDNILDPDLEKTDIGRIFLEADLQLKKDTSGMTSPQNPQGKEYWDKLYKKAGELFGNENITIPTITRPWIVPNEIIIRESPEGAYIYKATLKVMLEEDYLSNQKTEKPKNQKTEVYNFSDPRLKELNQYSTQLIRGTIIPKLTYEVNASKRYAPLRQVYYSLILAQWFKQKYGSFGSPRASGISAPVNSYIDLIDSGNLANLTSNQSYDKHSYFQQYQKSFKDGEYNLQEPIYTPMGQSIRRYVSGGINGLMAGSALTVNSVGMGLENNYLMPVAYDGAGIVSSAVMDKSDKNHAASSAVEFSEKIWYHGSSKNLTINNLDIEKTFGTQFLVKGFFVTTDRKFAAGYSNGTGSFGNQAIKNDLDAPHLYEIKLNPGLKILELESLDSEIPRIVDAVRNKFPDYAGPVKIVGYGKITFEELVGYIERAINNNLDKHFKEDEIKEIKKPRSGLSGTAAMMNETIVRKKAKRILFDIISKEFGFDGMEIKDEEREGEMTLILFNPKEQVAEMKDVLIGNSQMSSDKIDGSVSSVLGDKGGVDFAALPIQTQAMPGVSSALTSNFKPLTSAQMDAEWVQIQALVNAAIRPAPERLERYAASVSSSLDYPRARDKFVGLLADILRNDETSQRQPRLEPALKNILLALESE